MNPTFDEWLLDEGYVREELTEEELEDLLAEYLYEFGD
jgi:hypothetical protein